MHSKGFYGHFILFTGFLRAFQWDDGSVSGAFGGIAILLDGSKDFIGV